MAEEKGEIESAVAAPPPPPPSVQIPPQYDVNAKWDYCMDLGLRRVFYSTLAGSATGLLLFRSPVTRWASVAFAAGLGVGSAYSDCSHKFEGSAKSTPSVSEAPKVHLQPLFPAQFSFFFFKW
ncbi:OLC1v1015854C1 [Oldenlandia corymbosa var. corymbosa]|uniref:OLC1v1015854C1 n=1 Tax=Oldenlandia corymbosa var. corymbosa TaxID=529605 RepID=A0AAV1E6C3_OLDCO|nr:OLC1v1015854C1 [Oldenlandia corymbosa var. corymbosa]